jgi:4-alpha-glucanotransferase
LERHDGIGEQNMSAALDALAQSHGIALAYTSETGEHRVVPDETKRALLLAIGIDAGEEPNVAAFLAPAPLADENVRAAPCFVPQWLPATRVWGISCQLYGIRSERNHGIGDFEDLARLCEVGAACGADFIGTNPLHALFGADPERASPYAPSTRQFLNPLYIALDHVTGTEQLLPQVRAELEALKQSELVDYAGVAHLKRRILEGAFAVHDGDNQDFALFQREGGQGLRAFAIFEALSEILTAQGSGAGWHAWPEAYRDPSSSAVLSFAGEHDGRVRFHAWLQWLAATQLRRVQQRARSAGMRIGLYLDLAVGVAPDGAATWSNRALIVTGARIGAPPDMFNPAGQDWGLAPLSPAGLRQCDLDPFVRDVGAVMRSAGAMRIDHAMGIERQFWIPGNATPREGSYVSFPLEPLLEKLSQASHAYRALVVGEDLGTVPSGFRDRMRAAMVSSYRVMLFERDDGGRFLLPDVYPRETIACLATHDLPTLKGWWAEGDIALRHSLGILSASDTQAARIGRARDRQQLLDALLTSGLIDGAARDEAGRARELPESVATAAHVFVARTPSWLMNAQIEDLVGATEQVNLPGTHMEYPNWRKVLPVKLEQLASGQIFQNCVSAVARERPRTA